MKVYLGDWVECRDHHHIGRVTEKHHNFQETGENDFWFKGQNVPLEESDKENPWYSVLVRGGGAVIVPERCIIHRLELSGTDMDNPYASFYFRD